MSTRSSRADPSCSVASRCRPSGAWAAIRTPTSSPTRSADALLGALALGDLGQHFPDTDPRYRGISSLRLLGEVVDRVRSHGGRIVNVDATVVTEGPRLAGWLDAMRARLAETLGLAVDRVSVKAKRAERLGALGRHEGIAAMAVALVEVAG